jgi:hypothetical protein
MHFLTSKTHDTDFEEWHDVAIFTRDQAISFGAHTHLDFHSVAVPYLHGFAIIKTGSCRTRYDRAIIERERADILWIKGVKV